MLYDVNGSVVAAGGSGDVNPLEGKKICLIGDSNTQYSGTAFKEYFENTYGCLFTPLGYAGATWENGDGVTHEYSAVARVNALISGADEDTKLCTDYDIVLIMMGTNCTAAGTVTDTSETLTTMCGAARYCLEKLLYYYRKSKIGVILPPQRADGNADQESRNMLLKSICDEFSVTTCDLYHSGQIVPNASTPDGDNYYLNDGLHFGANGIIQFERTVGGWLASGMPGTASGTSLGLTGAAVGQIAKISAVDEDGKPTA